MLSSTIFPCSSARQRERMVALERNLDLRNGDVATAHSKLRELLQKAPHYASVQVVPTKLANREHLYVYDHGALRMTITPVEP